MMNDIQKLATLFDRIVPFDGYVPAGYIVDFLGVLTDVAFRTNMPEEDYAKVARQQKTHRPRVEGGEAWFEAADWVLSALSAKNRYVMICLGGCYGYQAVGAYSALQRVNPLPSKLVVVEPVPKNMEWVRKHMRDNKIDPAEHWLVNTAIYGTNDPVLFPVGAPGCGANNCIATNEPQAREKYASLLARENPEKALRNLLTSNTTGIVEKLGHADWAGEIKFVSAVTLADLLAPFEFIDYIDADIQQSEIEVFPPYLEILNRKARRIHIGTHGREVHWTLHRMFENAGWLIEFSFEPDRHHSTPLGDFRVNDGVLTVVNPALVDD
jgi:hypothetical protein